MDNCPGYATPCILPIASCEPDLSLRLEDWHCAPCHVAIFATAHAAPFVTSYSNPRGPVPDSQSSRHAWRPAGRSLRPPSEFRRLIGSPSLAMIPHIGHQPTPP